MALANIVLENNCKTATVGGAPYLMPILEEELLKVGVMPVYAYSERQVESITLEGGTTKKIMYYLNTKVLLKPLAFSQVLMNEISLMGILNKKIAPIKNRDFYNVFKYYQIQILYVYLFFSFSIELFLFFKYSIIF